MQILAEKPDIKLKAATSFTLQITKPGREAYCSISVPHKPSDPGFGGLQKLLGDSLPSLACSPSHNCFHIVEALLKGPRLLLRLTYAPPKGNLEKPITRLECWPGILMSQTIAPLG